MPTETTSSGPANAAYGGKGSPSSASSASVSSITVTTPCWRRLAASRARCSALSEMPVGFWKSGMRYAARGADWRAARNRSSTSALGPSSVIATGTAWACSRVIASSAFG